ncbi:hypothetical protein [Peribacillus sp. SI8-4]|uniref:hypothetical protein n=1 Tax=Peribacillus sp. SI8-4 TaxID=3048009 RepID=UPI00255477D8|nr:hypothetical protein [Peribacillus sp. SI8-4]
MDTKQLGNYIVQLVGSEENINSSYIVPHYFEGIFTIDQKVLAGAGLLDFDFTARPKAEEQNAS